MEKFLSLYYLSTILLVSVTTTVSTLHYPCEEHERGDLNLMQYDLPNEGRLAVCNGREWGTVCRRNFNTVDASVVCRQLGYSRYGAELFHPECCFTPPWINFFANYVDCNGTEERFIDCDMQIPGYHCDHSDDTGIICQELRCKNGDIRLVDGNQTMGRVELCLDEEWYTICLDNWRISNTEVFCRQLGYKTIAGLDYVESIPGDGSPIYKMNFECSGSEKKVFDCNRQMIAASGSCTHEDDLTLQCSTIRVCNTGEVRLTDGSNSSSGILEVCMEKEWGQVCGGEQWSEAEARVACHQLGFSGLVAIVPAAEEYVESNSSSIFFENISCSGSEPTLLSCQYNITTTDTATCTGGQQHPARVTCLPKFCENNEIRLVGGSSHFEGRLEICYGEIWGTVCSRSGWESALTATVCRELGFGADYAMQLRTGQFLATRDVPIYNIECSGNGTTFSNCTSGLNQLGCNHYQDVNIKCDMCSGSNGTLTAADNGEMRVELCHNGSWWSLCPDTWDDQDARVLCQQQHQDKEGTLQLARSGYYPRLQQLPVLVGSVHCDGDELTIADCRLETSSNKEECSSKRVAGVHCSVMPTPTPVIVDSLVKDPKTRSLLEVVLLPTTISALAVIILAIVTVVACIVGVRFRNRKATSRTTECNSYNPLAVGGERSDDAKDIIYDVPEDGIYEKIRDPLPPIPSSSHHHHHGDSMELNPYYTTTFKPHHRSPAEIPCEEESFTESQPNHHVTPERGAELYDYIDKEGVQKPKGIDDTPYDVPPLENTHYEPLRVTTTTVPGHGLYTVPHQAAAFSSGDSQQTAVGTLNNQYQKIIIDEKECDGEYTHLKI